MTKTSRSKRRPVSGFINSCAVVHQFTISIKGLSQTAFSYVSVYRHNVLAAEYANNIIKVILKGFDHKTTEEHIYVLNSVFVNGLNGRCWKVQEKSHRRMLMMLRGRSAPLQIETGRWKGVPREERLCRECGMNEVEDCDHWLLRCSRWDIERRHLLANVQQRLPNFASIIDDMQRSAVITDLACEDRRTAQLIYSMWTARFG